MGSDGANGHAVVTSARARRAAHASPESNVMRGDTVHNCALVAAGKRHLSQPPKVSGTVPAGLTSKPQRPVASIMLQHPRGKLQSTPRKSLPERCASPRWSTESTAEGVLHRTSRTQSWTTATFGLKGGAHSHVHWQSSPNMGLCHLPVLPLKTRRRGEIPPFPQRCGL